MSGRERWGWEQEMTSGRTRTWVLMGAGPVCGMRYGSSPLVRNGGLVLKVLQVIVGRSVVWVVVQECRKAEMLDVDSLICYRQSSSKQGAI